MNPIHLHYLNAPDIEALAMTDQEILDAVEEGLRAQGLGRVVIEPRMHLVPDKTSLGADPVGGTPEEFAQRLRLENTRWGEAIRKSGLKLND